MTGRPRRRGGPPTPLTPDERDEAERALDRAFREQLDDLEQQIRDLSAKRRALDAARTRFNLREQIDDDIGVSVYSTLSTAAQNLGSAAAFRGGDREAYEAARRAESLAGRWLRESGNRYFAEYGE